MLGFFGGFLRSTKTVIGILCVIALGELAKIAGDYGRIRYEEVELVALLQEINSRRVAARVGYPEVYFGCVAFLVFLIVHVYMTTTGETPTSNLTAMITGRHEMET